MDFESTAKFVAIALGVLGLIILGIGVLIGWLIL